MLAQVLHTATLSDLAIKRFWRNANLSRQQFPSAFGW